VVSISCKLHTAVDAKHNRVEATHSINQNDRRALSANTIEAKYTLGIATDIALVEKGYYNGKPIEIYKQA
jgi:hypothetical protein